MRRIFEELVMGTAQRAGFGAASDKGGCQIVINAAGLLVQAGLSEPQGTIILQSAVGLVPHDGHAEFYAMLLSRNNLFAGTQGLTLGIDPDSELVTLQGHWKLPHDPSGLDFDAVLANFCEASLGLLEDINAWTPEASQGVLPDWSEGVLLA